MKIKAARDWIESNASNSGNSQDGTESKRRKSSKSTGTLGFLMDDAPISFPYKPLDISRLEIRVLTLLPDAKSAPIACELNHVATNKGSRPSYKALSYTWGSPEIKNTISLQGTRVQVRENLWQALYHFRQTDAPLHIWIDAVCINQDDIPERN
jgi:hypothetical protein